MLDKSFIVSFAERGNTSGYKKDWKADCVQIIFLLAQASL